MLSDSSNYEKNIRNIISTMYVKDNVPFMDAVVLQLAKALKADHVFIGKLQEDKFSVKTLSHCMDNKIVDGFEYILKNSPCEVVYDGKVAVYPKNVTKIFPLDQDLVDLKIEGYAGIPLFNSKNKTFGAIIVLYRKPIENPDFVSSIMTLFANQVVNEIEKQHYIEEIETLNKTLQSKIERINEEIEKNDQKEKMLQRQSSLAQMGEMISMIAHQWRQPLNAINTSVIAIQFKIGLGKFDLSNENDREEFLQFLNKQHNNIIEYVKNLSETIDDFRNFFKPNKQKELVNLQEPINRALKIVENSMRSKGIEVNCDFQIDKQIELYQNEMMQVILNILKNSEDNFIEKNIQNAKIDITIYEQNDNYVISIKDNGGGIPQDILPNVFDSYFSTKNAKNGTGLGLYMSKIMIEEHHGGQLKAKNIENGVEFSINIKNIVPVI